MELEILPWTFMSNDLVEAVYNDDVRKVEELIKEGADINVSDESGNSLLWHAYINDFHEIMIILLNAGVNVNQRSGDLLACDLHRACAYGSINFVEVLLACDGDVNVEDLNGRTPLILSVECRFSNYCLDLIKLLISKGARVNHQDSQGYSVLHYACQLLRLDAIDLLTKHCADPCLVNYTGFSPLTYTLAFICYTSKNDYVYELRMKIAKKLLSSIYNNYERISKCVGQSLHSTFDFIFYGLRTRHRDMLNIGWNILLSIKSHADFETNLCTVANTMCKANKSNSDIIYFFSNIQITSTFDLIIFYISHLPYNANVARANIIFYYCLAIDEGKSLQRLVNMHENILTQNYIDVINSILSMKLSKPPSLKCMCRRVIRNRLKHFIKQKLTCLMLPKKLEQFLLINELYALNVNSSFNVLMKLVENF